MQLLCVDVSVRMYVAERRRCHNIAVRGAKVVLSDVTHLHFGNFFHDFMHYFGKMYIFAPKKRQKV